MDFISKMNEGLVVNFQPLYCMSSGLCGCDFLLSKCNLCRIDSTHIVIVNLQWHHYHHMSSFATCNVTMMLCGICVV